MLHGTKIIDQGRTAQIFKIGCENAIAGLKDYWFECRKDLQTGGLAERDQSDSGGGQIGDKCMQIGTYRLPFVDRMAGASQSDRNRIGDLVMW